MSRISDNCSVQDLVHMLGKKWTIPIIEELSSGESMHFNGIASAIEGITPGMLAKELHELNVEGILNKKSISVNGTAYAAYSLTSKGILLAQLIDKAKELCAVCCPSGASCRYAYGRQRCMLYKEPAAAMVSNSGQYK